MSWYSTRERLQEGMTLKPLGLSVKSSQEKGEVLMLLTLIGKFLVLSEMADL